jgi:hypothetical protein
MAKIERSSNFLRELRVRLAEEIPIFYRPAYAYATVQTNQTLFGNISPPSVSGADPFLIDSIPFLSAASTYFRYRLKDHPQSFRSKT